MDLDKLHRFLWKYRNKIDDSVPWNQTHIAEMLGISTFVLNKHIRALAKEGRVHRREGAHTYFVADPRRYNAEGQVSLPGGKSDV